MTTIAYRNGVMAADSERNFNGLVTHDGVKVCRIGDRLYGFSGGAAAVHGYMLSVADRSDGDPWPPTPADRDGNPELIVLTVGSDRRLIRIGPLGAEPMLIEYFAEGSGGAVAMGAMHAGAGPRDAVLAACAHDMYTGAPVLVVSLDDGGAP